MKKKAAIDPAFHCEFCGATFKRAGTVDKHLCEQKQRWLLRDVPDNRMAHQCWEHFYRKEMNATKKKLGYMEFIKSNYYSAFLKFGKYNAEVKSVNPLAFVDWLLENQIMVDNWASDVQYTKFLKEYLRLEDYLTAVSRTIEYAIGFGEKQRLQAHDLFRHGNSMLLCNAIVAGRISPWVIYNSDSGLEFLARLNDDQQGMIMEYIKPELWKRKFLGNKETVIEVKEMLKQGGW